jgi:hypothetical protein
MGENTGATEAQGAEVTQPQGGTAQAQGAEAQQVEATSAEQSGAEDLATVRRKLADFERDNAKYRKRIASFETAEQERQQANLSEMEKAQQRIAELEREKTALETQRQELRVREAIVGTASRLGFTDPADAIRLLDVASLEYADDGTPKDVEQALKALLAAKPYLAPGGYMPAVTRGVQGGGTTTGDFNSALRRAAGITR